MAHERISSNDVAANLIIAWNDEDGELRIGVEWDAPPVAIPAGETAETAETPGSGEVNTAPADGEQDGERQVTEHRVEYSLGGRVEIPIEPYELRPYYNEHEGRWSFYLGFDRPKVNAIIRAIRRGRNKTFGADE